MFKDRNPYVYFMYVLMFFFIGYLIFKNIGVGIILAMGSGTIMGYVMSKQSKY